MLRETIMIFAPLEKWRNIICWLHFFDILALFKQYNFYYCKNYHRVMQIPINAFKVRVRDQDYWALSNRSGQGSLLNKYNCFEVSFLGIACLSSTYKSSPQCSQSLLKSPKKVYCPVLFSFVFIFPVLISTLTPLPSFFPADGLGSYFSFTSPCIDRDGFVELGVQSSPSIQHTCRSRINRCSDNHIICFDVHKQVSIVFPYQEEI